MLGRKHKNKAADTGSKTRLCINVLGQEKNIATAAIETAIGRKIKYLAVLGWSADHPIIEINRTYEMMHAAGENTAIKVCLGIFILPVKSISIQKSTAIRKM